MANNYLLTRVWYPVIHFEEVIEQKEWMEHEYFAQKMLRYYKEIVQAFKKRQELEAMALFERIFDLMGCAH
jgi:GntR family transcriptional repressor for pyruvate dehydrogenase complex